MSLNYWKEQYRKLEAKGKKNKCVSLPIFQDYGKHLERYLESCKNWEVPLVISTDGPFPGFPHDFSMSTDGTRELILSYDNTILLDSGVNYMPTKHNMTFHLAAKLNYRGVLIMGSDEYLEGDLNQIEVPGTIPIINILLEEHNPTGTYNHAEFYNPRLICNPMFVRCRDVHWWYFWCNQYIAQHELLPHYDYITIHCDDTFRPEKRDIEMTEWQTKNVERERLIMKEKRRIWLDEADYPPTADRKGNLYWTCGCIRIGQYFGKMCKRHTYDKSTLVYR